MPVSVIHRNHEPSNIISHSAKPNGVQCRLCWAANSSGSGGGGASATHTTLSSSGCMVHLFFQRWAVLFGAPCGCGAHGVDTVVRSEERRVGKVVRSRAGAD